MKKAVYGVMIITILAKILGFGREILLSYFFGASGVSDAYLISQTIPGTIFQFVGTGLATSFIPVYMRVKTKESSNRANYFTNTILSAVFLFSTVVVVVVIFFTKPVVMLFASGFTGQILDTAILFTRIGIFSLYFSSMIYVFNSYLQANESFSIVAFVAIPNSIVIMAAIILGAKFNMLALPIGSLFAIIIQVIILWPAMKKKGYKFKLNLNFKDEYVREICFLMIPVTIGVSVNQINVLVDRTIASQIAEGGISALTYADSLIMFVQGIFSQSIATVYYPSIAKLVEEKKEEQLRIQLNDAIESIVFMLTPIMIGCVVLAKGIVRLLYGRGAFDEKAIMMTGTALALYGVGILGYGLREILSRVLYAYHDTKTPMLNAVVGMILNILMNITLSSYLGIGGLALATSLSSIITALLLYFTIKKRYPYIFLKDSHREYVKIIIAAMCMGVLVIVLYNVVNKYMGNLPTVIVTILGGVIVYILMCKGLRIRVYRQLKELIVSRLK